MTKLLPLAFLLLLIWGAHAFSQTTIPEPAEKVVTEEIRLNVSALDRGGNAAARLSESDLVIMEDGRLHQAASVRQLPASVLIAMDTGGTMRQKKTIDTTRSTALAVAVELRAGTNFAVLNFHDRVEQLLGWSTDKSETLDVIANKASLGRRSLFMAAITEAQKILESAPTENRHLVLITDGLDSVEDAEARSAAIRSLWQSGIIVHVISYTAMEYQARKPLGSMFRKGEQNPKRVPEEVLESLAHAIPVRQIDAREILKQIYQPRLLSIIIDMPFLRHQRDQAKALATAQLQLYVLSEYTGGEFLLPETTTEMVEKAAAVARSINSQFIVTYTPKRPLAEAKADEIRTIEVTSRRPDIDIQARRRLVIFGAAETK